MKTSIKTLVLAGFVLSGCDADFNSTPSEETTTVELKSEADAPEPIQIKSSQSYSEAQYDDELAVCLEDGDIDANASYECLNGILDKYTLIYDSDELSDSQSLLVANAITGAFILQMAFADVLYSGAPGFHLEHKCTLSKDIYHYTKLELDQEHIAVSAKDIEYRNNLIEFKEMTREVLVVCQDSKNDIERQKIRDNMVTSTTVTRSSSTVIVR